MISRPNHCEPFRLRSLLNGRLPENEQTALAEHLEHCETCRRTLEGLAAASQWWTDIRRIAGTDDPIIPTVPMGDIGPVRESPSRLPFLEPSKNAEHLGRLGPYEVTGIIGQGGMGIVLKAHDPALHRVVAIKVLAPELATSAAARRRFAREAQAAAAVAHDHVVLIHAVDSAQGLPYLVMAYIPGRSLQERIERHGPLEVKEILRIGMQAASGLAAAHAQGLVHRDIKPANILLENGIERVKLTDFGLARAVDDASLTQSGVVTGTPQYMAPEQARGEAVDHRSDLFSLGSVLYAMAAGHSPFRAETTMAVLRRVSEESPRPLREINPEVPDWLAAIIAKLHAKDPARRYQSATEVANVLGRYLSYLQQPNLVPPSLPSVEKKLAPRPIRVRPWAVAALALLTLGVGVGAVKTTGMSNVAGFVATVLRIKTPDRPRAAREDNQPTRVRQEPAENAELARRLEQIRQAEEKLAEAQRALQKERADLDVRNLRSRLKQLEAERDKLKAQATETVMLPPTPLESLSVPFSGSLAQAISPTRLPQDPRTTPLLTAYNTFLGPGSSVWAIGVSPDGTRLAAATKSADHVGRLWLYERRTDESFRSSFRPVFKVTAPVRSVAFAPDGKTLACGEFTNQTTLRDPDSGTVRATLQGHTGAVNSIAFFPDGKRLATGSLDGTVRLWEIASGHELRVLRGHEDGVLAIAIAPDGRTLASAGKDQTVRLWDLEKRQAPRTLRGHTSAVESLAFAPDGKRLASAGREPIVRIWDVEKGRELQTRLGHDDGTLSLAFSRDGQALAAGTPDGTLTIWAMFPSDGIPLLRRFKAHEAGIDALAYTPDGRYLATGGFDGYVILWDTLPPAIVTGESVPIINSLAPAPGGVAPREPSARQSSGP